MQSQVITITPVGGIQGLQRKKGQGIDLRQFGHAEIERVSEIIWDEPEQVWLVNFLSGPCAGKTLTHRMCLTTLGTMPEGFSLGLFGAVAFNDYEDAVRAEVAYLDALRKQGVF